MRTIFNRLTWKIQQWIIGTVTGWIVIGGRCGCCGKWVDNCLVPAYWRVTICDDCAKEDVNHRESVEEFFNSPINWDQPRET